MAHDDTMSFKLKVSDNAFVLFFHVCLHVYLHVNVYLYLILPYHG